jgi:hypothetical protein
MANGIPYAEQVIWRVRHAEAPMHAVASYALNRLIVSAVLGAGVTIGAQYKIFKKWREKVLFKWSDEFPLLSLPFVKHQLGLEASYQDDCDPTVGLVTNHQPTQVTRPSGFPNGSYSSDLAAWCKQELPINVTNPPSPDDPGEVIGQGLEDVHNFGYDLGLQFWQQNQLCIDGQVWYEYFANLHQNPEDLWGLLECNYYHWDAAHQLDCTGGPELYGSLATALGCLDVDGPNAVPMSDVLYALLLASGAAPSYTYVYTPTFDGMPSGPPRVVFDWAAILVDAEELFTLTTNVTPGILAYNGQSLTPFGPFFLVNSWLLQLDNCVEDYADGGRYQDENLEMILGITEDDFEPCDPACPDCGNDELGACCKPNGQCEVTTGQKCDLAQGSFLPGAACSPGICGGGGGATGACCLPNQQGCIGGATAQECKDALGTFHPAKTCADIAPLCPGAALEGACCLPNQQGCILSTAPECDNAFGAFFVGKSCTDIASACPSLAPQGACCLPNQQGCIATTSAGCKAEFGTFFVGKTCADIAPVCPSAPAQGACCLPNQQGCIETTATVCKAQLGKFAVGKTCQDIAPMCPGAEPTSACCLPGQQGCVALTLAACEVAAGTPYPGKTCADIGKLCAPAEPVHACCLSTGPCENVTKDECAALGGMHYAGELCGANGFACPLPDPLGACCTKGGCGVGTASECASKGGSHFPGQTCLQVGCPPASLGGACCVNGQCKIVKSSVQCVAQGGVFHDAKGCEDIACGEPKGACCANGKCRYVTASQCSLSSLSIGAGGWFGGFYPGVPCSKVTCNGVGACCLKDGSCEIATGQRCAKAGGSFTDSATCEQADCCKDSPRMGCCVKGECFELTEPLCAQLGGLANPGLSCDEFTCCASGPKLPCCTPNGCDMVPTASACQSLGGTTGPAGATCSNMLCGIQIGPDDPKVAE